MGGGGGGRGNRALIIKGTQESGFCSFCLKNVN